MAKFVITGNFTTAGMQGMLAHPANREAAVRPMVEALGGKLLTYLVTTGESDFLMIVETADVSGIIPALLAAGATGGAANLRTAQAFTSAEFVTFQKRAGEVAKTYTPPNRA